VRARIRYRLTDSITAGDVEHAYSLLDTDERQRYHRFRFDRDRREFALAHALLRSTLSECGDRSADAWCFETAPGGKPRLAGEQPPSLTFNLSHTRGLVACIVAPEGDVGIDVECVTRSAEWRRLAERYFSSEEASRLERLPASDQPARFYELWTLKEAFAKALGVGIMTVLAGAVFAIDQEGRIEASLPVGMSGAEWQFRIFSPSADHRLAVAARGVGLEQDLARGD
jgi:4'-phosphopantetheinyl transferase